MLPVGGTCYYNVSLSLLISRCFEIGDEVAIGGSVNVADGERGIALPEQYLKLERETD